MGAYELTFNDQPTRCPRTGRFRKGHIPANKGKCWSDYMSKRSQRRSSKGWVNLKLHHATPCGGHNKRAVVCITDDGVFVGRFESGYEAALKSGAQQRNINLCCHYKRKHAGKTVDGRRLKWFFETDDAWLENIIEKRKI
jgi:hypothetical protein